MVTELLSLADDCAGSPVAGEQKPAPDVAETQFVDIMEVAAAAETPQRSNSNVSDAPHVKRQKFAGTYGLSGSTTTAWESPASPASLPSKNEIEAEPVPTTIVKSQPEPMETLEEPPAEATSC